MRHRWTRVRPLLIPVGILLSLLTAHAQAPPPATALANRVDARIKELETEASRLAAQSRTLLGDLQALEVQRDLETQKAKKAEADSAEARAALADASARLDAVEQQRVEQLPDLKRHLVALYMRGPRGYARLWFDAHTVRDVARVARTVAALTHITDLRVADHRRVLTELRTRRDEARTQTTRLETAQREAERARAATQKAVTAREALIAQIDARRDLNAQLVGELNVARQRLRDQIRDIAAGRSTTPPSVPIQTFKGALGWPVSGRVIAGFTGGRTGIDIGAAQNSPVMAVHGGTVNFANTFTGFGTLVILDHGDGYFSLYGYLAQTDLSPGDHVEAGAVVGQVGLPPSGPPALYFEMRVDGRPVDPLQWLRVRS